MKKMTRDELVSDLEKGKATFSEVSFRGEDLRGITIKVVTFRNCDFTGCNLSNTDITYTVFQRSKLERVAMQGAKVEDVLFDHVEFSDSGIVESTLTDVEFRHCNINFTEFRATQLNDLKLYFSTFLASTVANCELTISECTLTSFCHTAGLEAYSVGPVGTGNGGNVTYFPSLNKVFAGWWQGNEEEFFARCTEVTIKHDAELNLDLATDMVKRFMKKGE